MTSFAVVFDCMVFVQAIASRGSAHRCFEEVTSGTMRLLSSVDTLQELRNVLERPELQRKLPGITPRRVQALMHHLCELAVLIEPVPSHVTFPPDPKDEPYLDLAIEGKALCIVTRDRALLRLADPCDPLSSAISRWPELQVLVPEDFLKANRGLESTSNFS